MSSITMRRVARVYRTIVRYYQLRATFTAIIMRRTTSRFVNSVLEKVGVKSRGIWD